MSNYAAIIDNNLQTLFGQDRQERAAAMQAQLTPDGFALRAFGRPCTIHPDGIQADGRPEPGPRGIIISLYALNAVQAPLQLEPLKAFKEMPDSMPYVGAFANRTEQALVPAVPRIAAAADKIMQTLDGGQAPGQTTGDFSFVVRPLPKIALCYLFYEADEDFPPAVTCLYSSNAHLFVPTDALADVGEYTSQAILELLANP